LADVSAVEVDLVRSSRVLLPIGTGPQDPRDQESLDEDAFPWARRRHRGRAVLVAIPGRAQAQVGISVGFGSGSFYDPAYDDEFGWSPRYQPQNVYGYNSPVAYGYGTRVGYGYGSPYTAQPVVTTRRVVVRDTYRPRRVVVREVYEPRRVVVRRDYVAPRRVVTRTYGPAPVVRVRHY
jgi:hypothetical protein